MDYDTAEGVDSGVSEDAFADPVLTAYQTRGEQEYWIDELDAARKERSAFRERGLKTIKRYADERDVPTSGASNFNIFFANTEIKLSSLYARTPVPDIKRRFDDADDDVSRVAAILLQRNISYELECEGFDPKLKQMLFDRLVPGIGLGWLRLDQEEGAPHVDPTTGIPVPGSEITNQSAAVDYVAWDDFHWAPCRVWSECRWVARRIPMSKADVRNRFADKVDRKLLNSLSFALPTGNGPVGESMKPKHVTEATIDVLEIWDKVRGLIFWVTEGCEVPLDVQRDTNEFPDFFPTPLPPMGRFTTSNTTPIPDFALVQDQYNELDHLNNRASQLVRALQLKWVYDSSNPALRDLYTNAGELVGIPVKDWAVQVSEKGGLKNAMEFAPLDEIANTYQKLIQARDLVKQQIYEIEGIADFMRGVTNPYVTAAATQAAGAAGTSRLSVMQHEVADYIQRLLRLKAHLICKFYTPSSILERVGQLNSADQPLLGPALQLLKTVDARHFRLLVSVDSIQLPNWNQEKSERNELIQAITNLMGQLLPAVQQQPALAPLGLNLLKFGIAGYKGSKEIEGAIDAGLQQLTAVAQQPQPPKPTPEEIAAQQTQQKLQADLQKAQLEEETKRRIADQQAAIKTAELQQRDRELLLRERELDHRIAHDRAHTHIDVVDGATRHALELAQLGAA